MTAPLDTPVLIVGGGPVGFALALDLAKRGCSTTVVERESGVVQLMRGRILTGHPTGWSAPSGRMNLVVANFLSSSSSASPG